MKNARVWICKEQMLRIGSSAAPMDYSQAMQYGDLEFVTLHDMPMYVGPHSSVQEQWNKDVQKFVDQYDEQNDFIVTTGQPMAIFCIGWALGHCRKTPRFLVWRREENKYRVVNIDHNFVELAMSGF